MKTIDKIITKVDTSRGAPMGRASIGAYPFDKEIFDDKVPMLDSYYDKGGAYWGSGAELRVAYTKDLAYIQFYRN